MSKINLLSSIFLFFLLILIFVSLSFPSIGYASLATVKGDGRVVVNVLSATDTISLAIPKSESLKVGGKNVEVFRDGDTFKLAFNDSTYNITDYKDSVIEIEETPEKQNLKISVFENKFKIEQEEMGVFTNYPIEIDPVTKKISVKTETGNKFLSILPREASESALRSRVVSNISSDKNYLVEENGTLIYKLSGKRIINLFNVSNYEQDVEIHILASNAEVIFTNEPVWLKLVTFFLS